MTTPSLCPPDAPIGSCATGGQTVEVPSGTPSIPPGPTELGGGPGPSNLPDPTPWLLTTPGLIASGLVAAAVIGLGVYLWRRTRRSRTP
jgi:hypothetical protein